MEGDFELNKPGWYTTQNVVVNDFLDDDQYGNTWYSVKFQGDAATYLWLAKDQPEEDKAYYGHLEKTKSGKAVRFKKDVIPDEEKSHGGGASAPKAVDYEPGTNARWAIGMAYRAYIQATGTIEDATGDFPFEAVKQHAVALVRMFNEIKNEAQVNNVFGQDEPRP